MYIDCCIHCSARTKSLNIVLDNDFIVLKVVDKCQAKHLMMNKKPGHYPTQEESNLCKNKTPSHTKDQRGGNMS